MPTPDAGENRGQFNARCMSDPEAVNDYPDEGQRFAVCNSIFERSQTSRKTQAARMTDGKPLQAAAKGTSTAGAALPEVAEETGGCLAPCCDGSCRG